MTCQLRHRAFNDLRDEGRMHAICMERSLQRGVYPPAADGEQWPTSDGPDRVAERASAIPDKRIVVHASASRAHAVALHRTTTGRVASLHPVAWRIRSTYPTAGDLPVGGGFARKHIHSVPPCQRDRCAWRRCAHGGAPV